MAGTLTRRSRLSLFAIALLVVIAPRPVRAQGFISPSFGYTFGGDAGCPTATDCTDKNWNWGGSLGSLGSLFGVEMEFTHASEFTGSSPAQKSSVTTVMGNFMLAPRVSIVQPYGLIGIGLVRTTAEDPLGGSSNSKNQAGWTVGGGLILYVQTHVGLKGDIRYYHSFQKLDLLPFAIPIGQKIDFGRAAFGVVLKF
jgi:opacity protein-like surface antigen